MSLYLLYLYEFGIVNSDPLLVYVEMVGLLYPYFFYFIVSWTRYLLFIKVASLERLG